MLTQWLYHAYPCRLLFFMVSEVKLIICMNFRVIVNSNRLNLTAINLADIRLQFSSNGFGLSPEIVFSLKHNTMRPLR